jgi:DNA-binding NarL/FixJ family response regulator
MNTKNKINIFIVEDNEVFALALKANIETAFPNKPIMVHIFESGETCIEKFKKEKPQVVILDYNLNSTNPDAVDGIKVLVWIKRENPETNVIMLTNNDNIDIATKSFRNGASDYVVKTETQFRKINNSLFNLFRIMEAKSAAIKFKYLFFISLLVIMLVVVAAIAIQIFAPSIYNK